MGMFSDGIITNSSSLGLIVAPSHSRTRNHSPLVREYHIPALPLVVMEDTIPSHIGWKREILQRKSSARMHKNPLTQRIPLSSERIDFLDVRVFKGNDGTLCTDLFRKQTAVNSLLNAKSSHPTQM
ncbi:uncharacterized protein ACNLHF_011576 [Anomaloglossus baeobatrachus]